MDKKKRLELRYVEEARRASSIFPSGQLVPHDPPDPDILLPGSVGSLGVEVTEICRQPERGEGARLGYVARKAMRLYGKRPGARPVNVTAAFSNDADRMTVHELAEGLAEFVNKHRNDNGSIQWYESSDMPKGYSEIGVFQPGASEPPVDWQCIRAWSGGLGSKELIEARIAKKNVHLTDYRKAAPEVWLLIVSDRFLGPGEVCFRLQNLKDWTFDSDFDKVLLFERQAGGSGEVIQLRRR
jgi:hypothetical protein